MSLPAFAGGASTYVENSYNLRNIYNGRSQTNVKVDSTYEFDRTAQSNASKIGTTSSTTMQSASGNKDGFAINQSFVEKDNFNISNTSSVKETGSGSENKTVTVSDSYSYNGFDKTHRVTSGFGY
ncbi:MAG: hypothetical protein HC799_19950 [Limnothrix sp. RL_2_0]|nr:hypothetical protein [Limnothrix sp. RL_2_0]